jgi:large subunit ribosomal protein L14e
VKAALTKQATLDQWNKSAWAQKLARRATRANLSDFDRFKVMVARKQVSCGFLSLLVLFFLSVIL